MPRQFCGAGTCEFDAEKVMKTTESIVAKIAQDNRCPVRISHLTTTMHPAGRFVLITVIAEEVKDS